MSLSFLVYTSLLVGYPQFLSEFIELVNSVNLLDLLLFDCMSCLISSIYLKIKWLDLISPNTRSMLVMFK